MVEMLGSTSLMILLASGLMLMKFEFANHMKSMGLGCLVMMWAESVERFTLFTSLSPVFAHSP